MKLHEYFIVAEEVESFIVKTRLRNAVHNEWAKRFLESWQDWFTAMGKAVMRESERLNPGNTSFNYDLYGEFELAGASGLVFENLKNWLRSQDAHFKDLK